MEQNQLFQQLLEQQARDNPQLQAMMALMEQMKAGNSEKESRAERELIACRTRLSKAASRIKQLTEEVEELLEEISALEHFEEDLSQALGACTFCWGEDPTCRGCRGRGKPGSFEPDPALFEKFVLPAFRRSRANLQ